MVELREPKETDREEAKKAYSILIEAMQAHPEIEQTVWASACWSCLISGYMASEIPFECFEEEVDSVVEFYKERWEENDS